MDNSIVTGIFTLSGTTLGAIVAYSISARTTRLQREMQKGELGFKMAIESYTLIKEQGAILARSTGQPVQIPTVPVIVAQGIRMAEIVTNPKLTSWEIGVEIGKFSDFTETVQRGTKSA